MDNIENMGDKIREFRTSINMTQADFAWRLGVTGASVSAYENGVRVPSYPVLIRIANILGVTTDALLGRRKNGDVTIDITPLNKWQREVVRKTVNGYIEQNRMIMAMFKDDSVEDRLDSLGFFKLCEEATEEETKRLQAQEDEEERKAEEEKRQKKKEPPGSKK